MAHLEAGGAWLPDTLDIIGSATELDPERMREVYPRTEAELVEALLIIWGHGVHDSCAGSVDTVGHVFRVGRHILETDSQGFTTVGSYGTEEAAEEVIEFVSGLEAD